MKLLRSCFVFAVLLIFTSLTAIANDNTSNKADYKNFAIIISGPSGVGKTTLTNAFLARNKNINVAISATTRTKRGNEVDGKDYYFISKDSFKKLIEKGEFMEYDNYLENYYGSSIRFYVESQTEGKDVIYNLTIKGMENAKKKHPEFDFVTIFIAPPSLDVLYQRLKNRNTDTEKQIKKRFLQAQKEMEYAKEYDYIVYNCNLDDTIKMIETIYLAEQRKRELPKECFVDKRKFIFN